MITVVTEEDIFSACQAKYARLPTTVSLHVVVTTASSCSSKKLNSRSV